MPRVDRRRATYPGRSRSWSSTTAAPCRSTPIVEPLRDAIGAVLVRKRQGGPGAARNLGVARARGRYIVFTDDDCTFDEGAIVAFVDGAGGCPGRDGRRPDDQRPPGNPFAAASQAIVDAVYAYNNPDPADARFFASNNMAVERSAILACGGFDESFNGRSRGSRALRPLAPSWRPPRLPPRGRHLPRPRPPARELRAPASRLWPRRVHLSPRAGARGSGRMRDDLRFHAELPARLLASARRVPAGTAARGAALAVVWQAVNAAGWAEAAATERRSESRSGYRAAGPAARPLAPHDAGAALA